MKRFYLIWLLESNAKLIDGKLETLLVLEVAINLHAVEQNTSVDGNIYS